MLFEAARNDDGYHHQDGGNRPKYSKKEKVGCILLGLCLVAGALLYTNGINRNSENDISMINRRKVCEIEMRQIKSQDKLI